MIGRHSTPWCAGILDACVPSFTRWCWTTHSRMTSRKIPFSGRCGLDGFRQDSEFSTWLCSIAMNCVRSYFSRRPPPVAPLDATLNLSINERPESAAIGQELSEAIRRALERLSPKLRSAIVLISLNGLDASQAAAVEGCTAATMHSRLHEARAQLKRLLKGHLS